MSRSAVSMALGFVLLSGIAVACDQGGSAAPVSSTTLQEAPISGVMTAMASPSTAQGYSGQVTLTALPTESAALADYAPQQAVISCGVDPQTAGVARVDLAIRSTTKEFPLQADYKLYVTTDSAFTSDLGNGHAATQWLTGEALGDSSSQVDIVVGSKCAKSQGYGMTGVSRKGGALQTGELFTDSVYVVFTNWRTPANPAGLTGILYYLKPSLYVESLGGDVGPSGTTDSAGTFHWLRFATHP